MAKPQCNRRRDIAKRVAHRQVAWTAPGNRRSRTRGRRVSKPHRQHRGPGLGRQSSAEEADNLRVMGQQIAPQTALPGSNIRMFLGGGELMNSTSGPPPSKRTIVATTGIEVSRLMGIADAERRPDDRAFARAHLTLVELSDHGFEIPANDVYADPDRAIRLLWSKDGRSAEMVFPSVDGEAPYLYRSDDHEYAIEENPGVECLLAWLRWVANGANSVPSRAA